jgi:phenol 2-monooxygenase
VRPDQYVADVLPLSATEQLAGFFGPLLKAEAGAR